MSNIFYISYIYIVFYIIHTYIYISYIYLSYIYTYRWKNSSSTSLENQVTLCWGHGDAQPSSRGAVGQGQWTTVDQRIGEADQTQVVSAPRTSEPWLSQAFLCEGIEPLVLGCFICVYVYIYIDVFSSTENEVYLYLSQMIWECKWYMRLGWLVIETEKKTEQSTVGYGQGLDGDDLTIKKGGYDESIMEIMVYHKYTCPEKTIGWLMNTFYHFANVKH